MPATPSSVEEDQVEQEGRSHFVCLREVLDVLIDGGSSAAETMWLQRRSVEPPRTVRTHLLVAKLEALGHEVY